MPDDKPKPPEGYKLSGSIDMPADTKMSPDIEDRRDWGPIRTAVGKQGQDFTDYWRDVRATYPDFHTAYRVIRDGIMKDMNHSPTSGQTSPSGSPQAAPIIPPATANRKIGDTKRFQNGKTGVWDGHGWVAK